MVSWVLWLLIACFAASGCSTIGRHFHPESDGKYDYSSSLVSTNFDILAHSWPRIFVSGSPVLGKGEEEKIQEEVRQSGRALIIPPYVLTLAHIVDLTRIEITVITPVGQQTTYMVADRVEKEEFLLRMHLAGKGIALEKIFISPETDIALFKIPDERVNSFLPVRFGYSDELMIGNKIFILGSSRLSGSYVWDGIVSNKGDFSVETHPSSWDGKNGIVLSTPVISGDSGSPVLALRDGVPEIVGLINVNFLRHRGAMIAIDFILEFVLKQTGIDLRDLHKKNLNKAN